MSDASPFDLSELRLRFQVDPDVDYAELEAEGLDAAARCEANGDDFSAARAWRLVSWARYGLCQLEGMREPAERAYEFDSAGEGPHYPHDDLVGIIVALSFGPTPASRALVGGVRRSSSGFAVTAVPRPMPCASSASCAGCSASATRRAR